MWRILVLYGMKNLDKEALYIGPLSFFVLPPPTPPKPGRGGEEGEGTVIVGGAMRGLTYRRIKKAGLELNGNSGRYGAKWR